MSARSAGILLYRTSGARLEVLLVHPGGPFWAGKDVGAWSVPKGEYGEDEDPLDAARREFEEETGVRPEGEFFELTPIRQRGGKTVAAWAVEGDLDPDAIRSDTFELEWPPKSGRVQEFPEIDQAGWFSVETAAEKVNPAQVALLRELTSRLGSRRSPTG